MFRITSSPIDRDDLLLDHPEAGGYVLFEGRVRNRNEGQAVLSLEYEAYEELAVAEGEKILIEAREKFEIIDAGCTHRIGHLQIGDIAVVAVASAAHRQAAFLACEYIIDETKRRVPIWKKEHYVEGPSNWIGQHSG
jgi:molybdopterin synthase catalytic subunit